MSVTSGTSALTARSVVLSLLLGNHPAELTSRELTRAAEYFGLPAPTVRVSLTRAVASGELLRDGSAYRLGNRLLARQARQDEAVSPRLCDWDGSWEMAIVVVTGRSSSDRAQLREELARLRLGELREGVWMRPANLRRPPGDQTADVLRTFRACPDGDPGELARLIWDLGGWARSGRELLSAMKREKEPSARFLTAAAIVRLLTSDPILPEQLLPEDWPGQALREAYAAYQGELRTLVALAGDGDRQSR